MNSKNNSTNLSNFKNSLEKELKKLKSKLDEAQKTSDIQESSYKHKINYYHNRISDLYTYVEKSWEEYRHNIGKGLSQIEDMVETLGESLLSHSNNVELFFSEEKEHILLKMKNLESTGEKRQNRIDDLIMQNEDLLDENRKLQKILSDKKSIHEFIDQGTLDMLSERLGDMDIEQIADVAERQQKQLNVLSTKLAEMVEKEKTSDKVTEFLRQRKEAQENLNSHEITVLKQNLASCEKSKNVAEKEILMDMNTYVRNFSSSLKLINNDIKEIKKNLVTDNNLNNIFRRILQGEEMLVTCKADEIGIIPDPIVNQAPNNDNNEEVANLNNQLSNENKELRETVDRLQERIELLEAKQINADSERENSEVNNSEIDSIVGNITDENNNSNLLIKELRKKGKTNAPKFKIYFGLDKEILDNSSNEEEEVSGQSELIETAEPAEPVEPVEPVEPETVEPVVANHTEDVEEVDSNEGKGVVDSGNDETIENIGAEIEPTAEPAAQAGNNRQPSASLESVGGATFFDNLRTNLTEFFSDSKKGGGKSTRKPKYPQLLKNDNSDSFW